MSDPQEASTASSPPQRRRPTIYDIAERLSLNPSTVSRALNKPGRINSETEARVRAVAQELGFRVNRAARALPTGTTGTYGLILPDITNPVHFALIRGVEEVTRSRGFTLTISESEGSAATEKEAITSLQNAVDGLLVVASRLAPEVLVELAAITPIVASNSASDALPSVIPDIAPGLEQAILHLKELGHRSIAYLGLSGADASQINRGKWDLLFDLATAQGLSIVEIPITAPTVDGGAESLRRIVASGTTAVFAYNDLVAHGVLRAARTANVRVPDDFSLIGFDDIFSAELAVPALTTLRVPLREIGSTAMSILLDPASNRTPSQQTLPIEFIVRESTSSAPSR